MTGRFNPNDPTTIGLEWPATSALESPIDPSRELAHLCTMVTNRTVKNLNFYSPSPLPGATSADFCDWILATVYETGQEQNAGTVRTAPFAVSGGSTTGAFIGGAVSVADALNSSVDGKGIELEAGELVDIEFTVPFFLTANAPRILNVEFINLTAVPVTGVGRLQAGYRLSTGDLVPLGTMSAASTAPSRQNSLNTGEVFLGGYNYIATPTEDRRRVWRSSDFTSLNNGTVRFRYTNTGTARINLMYVAGNATYCQENRAATGGLIRAAHVNYPWVPGWQANLELADPSTGTVGVTLLAGREYTVTLTQASDRSFTSEATETLTSVQLYRQSGASRNLAGLVPVDASPLECRSFPRLDDGRIAGDGADVRAGFTWVVIDSSGVSVPELSQPYAEVITLVTAAVGQFVDSATGGMYGSVRVTVKKIGTPGDMQIDVVGLTPATTFLTVAMYDAAEPDESGFRTIDVPLPVAVSLAAGTNAVILATTGSGVDHWEVPVLSTVSLATIYTSVTYGGTDLTPGNPGLDVPMLLTMAAPAPTGASIGVGIQELGPVVTGCPSPPSYTSLEYNSICWGQVPIVTGSPQVTGAPAVTGFCAWEVQRSDGLDPEWRLIARLSDYDVLCVSDFEARFGVESNYRVRLCRVDGVCGPWATVTGAPARAAPTADGNACDGLVFTSNEAPDQTVAYPYAFDGAPLESFGFVEAETVIVQRLHMRDYQVVMRPLERGGVRFTRTMLVNAIAVPAALLDEGFRGLRDLAWATLSYVAVLDTRGNRWFASVIVPSGDVRASLNVYVATVDVVEVTDRPSVIDVEAF